MRRATAVGASELALPIDAITESSGGSVERLPAAAWIGGSVDLVFDGCRRAPNALT
jgi:hypothetical protein